MGVYLYFTEKQNEIKEWQSEWVSEWERRDGWTEWEKAYEKVNKRRTRYELSGEVREIR